MKQISKSDRFTVEKANEGCVNDEKLKDPDVHVYDIGSDEDEDKRMRINKYNRMHLRNISNNNEYFLFEDRAMKELRVYKLESPQDNVCIIFDNDSDCESEEI